MPAVACDRHSLCRSLHGCWNMPTDHVPSRGCVACSSMAASRSAFHVPWWQLARSTLRCPSAWCVRPAAAKGPAQSSTSLAGPMTLHGGGEGQSLPVGMCRPRARLCVAVRALGSWRCLRIETVRMACGSACQACSVPIAIVASVGGMCTTVCLALVRGALLCAGELGLRPEAECRAGAPRIRRTRRSDLDRSSRAFAAQLLHLVGPALAGPCPPQGSEARPLSRRGVLWILKGERERDLEQVHELDVPSPGAGGDLQRSPPRGVLWIWNHIRELGLGALQALPGNEAPPDMASPVEPCLGLHWRRAALHWTARCLRGPEARPLCHRGVL